jgi:hypothetical protein
MKHFLKTPKTTIAKSYIFWAEYPCAFRINFPWPAAMSIKNDLNIFPLDVAESSEASR